MGTSDAIPDRLGIINFISWCYLALGLAFVWASLTEKTLLGVRFEPVSAVVPGIIALGAVGTLLRKNWGRRISYFTSVLVLPGVPIGTVLGGFMIVHLTRHKDLFVTPKHGNSES